MLKKILDEQQLKTVYDVLAETDSDTKTQLTRLLQHNEMEAISDGGSSAAYR